MGQTVKIQDVVSEEISLNDARNMVIIYKGKPFKYFDEGCTRYVFVNEDRSKVIKLLRRDIGLNYNEEEVKIYERASDEDKAQMAKPVLHNGFVEQDFCLPIKFGGKRLTIPQKLFASSCRDEVGWTEEGTLVCFDLDEFKKY